MYLVSNLSDHSVQLPKKSRPRRGPYSARPTEYHLTDEHSRLRIRLLNPLRFQQLIARGLAVQVSLTVARLRPFLALVSADLAENGEPRLRAIDGEAIWPRNTGCPTGAICETLWRLSGRASYTLAEVEAAIAARDEAIQRETLLWGLPAQRARVVSRQME